MKILHVCWSYPSECAPHEGSFFRNIAEPVSELGLQVTVAVPVPYVPWAIAKIFPQAQRPAMMPIAYKMQNVQVVAPRYVRLPRWLGFDVSPSAMAECVFSRIDVRPDLVHAHFAYPYGLVALHLKRKWKIPVVLTLHGSDGYSFPYLSKLNRQRFTAAVRGADAVLAVSNDIVRHTMKITGREAQLWPIGIDLRRFRRSGVNAQTLRHRLQLPAAKHIVIFVGHLLSSKGIAFLVSALEQLPHEVHGLVIGDGPLRRLVQHHSRIHWIPAVPNEVLPLYLSAADVMVLPTQAEGMPTVLIEAGAVGLPVIATNVSSIPELLDNDRGVLVEYGDATALANMIEQVLADRPRSMIRARRFSDFVAERYDCHKNSIALASYYRDLAQSGPAAALSDPESWSS